MSPARSRLTGVLGAANGPLGDRWTVVWLLLGAVAIGAAAYLLGSVTGLAVPYPIYVALALAILVGVRVLTWLAPLRREAAPVREETAAPTYGLPDRPFAGVRTWEDRFELIRGDRDYYRRAVHPRIVALIDDRLRIRHAISIDTQPEQAAELLGPTVWTFVTADPAARVPTPGELAAVVKELDRL